MFDLSTYLARLDLPARPLPDAAGLAQVQLAHRLAIPFENLDVMLGRVVAIDSTSVFNKLVTTRRGGFCFEHNRLFADAIEALGFRQRPLLARVWLGVSKPPPLTHTLSLVRIGEQNWIADPGFGGSYAPPMPLIGGALADAPDGAQFRLEDRGDAGWMLWREGSAATTDGRGTGPGWREQYSFTLDSIFPADLAIGAHWAATAPGTRFTTHRIVSIVLPHGFASLTDRFYRRCAREMETEGMITDPRVYRMRLGMLFGIDLAAEDSDRLFAGAD